MPEKTLTQFIDEYENFCNEGRKHNIQVEEFSTYMRKNLAKLVDECTDENGILDLCDSRIFFEGAFYEEGKKPEEKINIPEIIISAPIKIIPKKMFFHSKVEKVILPDGLKEIGESAFHHCESLKEINLPDGLKEIGE